MIDITVKFKNFPALQIELKDHPLARQYKEFVRRKLQDEPPIFFDSYSYDTAHIRDLCAIIKKELGWDWLHDTYNLETTTRMHRDLETYLRNGFSTIPEQHDMLLTEIHACLHAIETSQITGMVRDATLTVEWFTDDNIPMPEDFEFSLNMEYGDVKLQNPRVGHPPFMVFCQNDTSDVESVCKFHDIVRPGIVLCIAKEEFIEPPSNWKDIYKEWWDTTAPEFVRSRGIDNIMRYTGWPIIGRVLNIDVLDKIREEPSKLELEKVEVF